jgi:hypothetical protein
VWQTRLDSGLLKNSSLHIQIEFLDKPDFKPCRDSDNESSWQTGVDRSKLDHRPRQR